MSPGTAETIGPGGPQPFGSPGQQQGGFPGQQGGFGGQPGQAPGQYGQQGSPGQQGWQGQQQGQFGQQGQGQYRPPGQQGQYGQQAQFGQQGQYGQQGQQQGQQPRFAQPQAQFGQQQGQFGSPTMPPTMGPQTMGPGAVAGGPQTNQTGGIGGQGMPGWQGQPPVRPLRQRRFPVWVYAVGGAVVVVVILAVIGSLNHKGNTSKPVEQLSKIIKPIIERCRTASNLNMTGVTTSLACSTSDTRIGLSAYQYDNVTDFQSGLAHLNGITGWDPSASGKSCPPPAGSSTGREGWHTLHNPKYKTARSDQILECYTNPHETDDFLYLWTLPTQRVILVAGNPGADGSYTNLQDWWKDLNYG